MLSVLLETVLYYKMIINILLDWSKHWLLSFNILKCKVLHIGNGTYTGNYTKVGIQLELLDNIQDLGIQIDSKLKFHIHTDTVQGAYCVLGFICKSFECKDCDVTVKLYTPLFAQLLNITLSYGDPLTHLTIKKLKEYSVKQPE